MWRAYPAFIPWISSVRTGPERGDGEGVTVLDADASVGFSVVKERFSHPRPQGCKEYEGSRSH